MKKTQKAMSAFTALSETQQKTIMGGQDPMVYANAFITIRESILHGASSAGSAAGSMGAGAVKP